MTNLRPALLTLLLGFITSGQLNAGELREQLTSKTLLSDRVQAQPVAMAAFTPPAEFVQSHNQFEGRLKFSVSQETVLFELVQDDMGYAADPAIAVRDLPPFNFDLIQTGDQLVPATRGVVTGDHPHWEWLLEPGRVWQEAGDGEYSRAALPFSLVQRGENCTHNGVLSFLFKRDGSISRVALQIASETCLYFKFVLWAISPADYLPGPVHDKAHILQRYTQERERRLPVRPIAALPDFYAGAEPEKFGGTPTIDPQDMTLYGLVIDGVNYLGGCQTRRGPYPFCEAMDLPSYSLAKSLLGGLGLMRLEKLYPGSADALIAEYVPQCDTSGQWQGTSFKNTLNMATGNFDSAHYDDDESGGAMLAEFFEPISHAEKIAFACEHYRRQRPPGEKWVYHTSDTYVLGTAMQSYLSRHAGPEVDLFDDVLLPWWQPLGLSPTSRVSRRSYDPQAQLFTGYGLFLHADDIAKLASFANSSAMRQQVDPTLLDAALQRDRKNPGLPAMAGNFYYNNGFWAYPNFQSTTCKAPINLPFMLGYGGINVVLMPNGSVYYYFSDGGNFSWLAAAQESDRIKPFCSDEEEAPDDNTPSG